MKKLIVVIIIVAAIVGLYFLSAKKSTAPLEQDLKTSSRPELSNLTFSTDDGPVTLKNGKAEVSSAPDTKLTDEYTLTDIVGYGDLNGDKKDDSVGLIIDNTTGTGVFIYLAGAISGPVSYKGTNLIFIGDRITPQSVSINNSVITVKYLDRKPDEPFSSEPTVETSKTFVYKGGELIEK